ncbi:hypothetical protein NMG60_11029795 [Bertholletia excelsa]
MRGGHFICSAKFSMAYVGGVIVAMIKKLILHMPLGELEVIKVVIVHTCIELKCDNGMIIQYDDNAATVIDQERNPKRT